MPTLQEKNKQKFWDFMIKFRIATEEWNVLALEEMVDPFLESIAQEAVLEERARILSKFPKELQKRKVQKSDGSVLKRLKTNLNQRVRGFNDCLSQVRNIISKKCDYQKDGKSILCGCHQFGNFTECAICSCYL